MHSLFLSKGAVWKAIVDHKLMRAANEHFGSDYYQKLLSNCSVTKNLSSAAKQGSSNVEMSQTILKFPVKNLI